MVSPLEMLAYYDVLDRPLTISELSTSDSPLSIRGSAPARNASRSDAGGEGVAERDGYYYLFDREYLVPLRKERERIAKRKWGVAKRVMRWLRLVPFIRVVFASGSLSMNNTDEQSDLDIIIIAKHGRIWTTRLLVNGLLSLLGRRRKHQDRIAPDKICPNHFITDQSLHIPFHSMYTAQLYANLVPLIAENNQGSTLIKNFQKENAWVLEYVAQWQMPKQSLGLSRLQKIFEFLLVPFANWLESKARDYQRQRIERNTTAPRIGGHLVYNDEALAFHAGSNAGRILEEYHKRISSSMI